MSDLSIALRRYPRRGRKKEHLNGKQSGGNEFITDYIYKHTGIWRDRKQVSSHIQVLKGFMADNPACLYSGPY
jgi:transcriptional enhancer factor